MTLPKDGRKLDQNEIESIQNAVEQAFFVPYPHKSIQIKWKVLQNIWWRRQDNPNSVTRGGHPPLFHVY